MAIYKYWTYLKQTEGEAFDDLHAPGDPTPFSGIYRCEGCGDEVACNKGNPLPSQNHHKHVKGLGPIQWKLIVFALTQV